MNNDYRSPAFKKWLDKLQQESWQLELIISGFAIYALILAYEPIIININTVTSAQNAWSTVFWLIIFCAWAIFIFNLTLHIILRSLWIGALGLRYVSGDINYDELNYTKKFNNYLKKKVGSFDKYISKLENYCSVLFAISFLVFFYFLSVLITFIFIGSVVYLINEIPFIDDNPRKIFSGSIFFLLTFMALIIFIDFIGRGFLKKIKWLSKIYFPIYWLFSFITLSFLYRPLVYNFLDNKFGRKLSLMLVPFYLGIVFLTTFNYKNSNYIFKDKTSSEIFIQIDHYDDLLTDETDFAKIASIPSKIISTPYLKVFLLYSEKIEDQIIHNNKDLKPINDLRGFKSDIITINLGDHTNDTDLRITYLETLKKLYTIQIDTTKFYQEYVISTNQKERLGFETYLNIRDLTEGKHILRIFAPPADSTKVENDTLVTIPFWHYKK